MSAVDPALTEVEHNINQKPFPQRIIRLRDLPTYCGLQRTVIEGLIAAGQFPKPIKLSVRANGWLADEIVAWQHERIAERDSKVTQPDARHAGR